MVIALVTFSSSSILKAPKHSGEEGVRNKMKM